MTSATPTDFNDPAVVKKPLPKTSAWWLGLFLQQIFRQLVRQIGHQAFLEKWNRFLLSAVTAGFLITIATYGWVVHQKFTMQQLIQETQAIQESNTARSIHLNRLQSFTGIMKNAQDSQWLSAPKETLTLMAPMGQPLPQTVAIGSALRNTNGQDAQRRWPIVTGY
ncbi:MAG: hypothetical protein QE263_02155 [Vampirovibrionales bacterium]|nr:hypothetical protein [Vampirovibrionales bacterium]